MHPEQFELKALIAGRLDNYRRREIDDHLGSCAECSRQYVAMMLGSTTPKTAEAEARLGALSRGSGAALAGATTGADSLSEMYGIDAPLDPPTFRKPAGQSAELAELLAPEPVAARTRVPVSASLVHAIAKLRAESDAERAAADWKDAPAAAPFSPVIPTPEAPIVAVPVAPVAPVAEQVPEVPAPVFNPRAALPTAELEIIMPVTAAPLMELSEPEPEGGDFSPSLQFEPTVIMPTPIFDEAIDYEMYAPPRQAPAPKSAAPAPARAERAESPAPKPAPTPAVAPKPAAPPAAPKQDEELVVTFTSTPSWLTSYRSPDSVPAVAASAGTAPASAAPAAKPAPAASAFELARRASVPTPPVVYPQSAGASRSGRKPVGLIAAGIVVLAIAGIGGYSFFQSSVSKAAAEAALAATKQIEANTPKPQQVAAPAAAAEAAPVKTRIVYVEKPSKPDAAPAPAPEPQTVVVPVAISIPDVNVNTGTSDASAPSASGNAVNELTRTARATATRTSAPRPQ